MSQLRAGNIKAYAVTAKNRIAVAPDIPTTDEAGLPRVLLFLLARAVGAQGHAAGHHREAQRRRRECVGRPAWRAKLVDLAQEIFPREQQTSEALLAYHQAEIEKWWPIIKAADIKAQ